MMTVALALGLLIGALVGLLGGGGSILAVPALVYALGLPRSTPIGTSLLIAAANSPAGFAAPVGEVALAVPVTVALTASAVAAALAAARLRTGMDTTTLPRWFARLVFTVSTLTL